MSEPSDGLRQRIIDLERRMADVEGQQVAVLAERLRSVERSVASLSNRLLTFIVMVGAGVVISVVLQARGR